MAKIKYEFVPLDRFFPRRVVEKSLSRPWRGVPGQNLQLRLRRSPVVMEVQLLQRGDTGCKERRNYRSPGEPDQEDEEGSSSKSKNLDLDLTD